MTTSRSAAPLAFDGVRISLAGRDVLNDVTFDCPAGAITALLGPNGAGKTTTVDVAVGLRRAGRGSVRVRGLDVGSTPARSQISLVPQEIGFPHAVGVESCLALVLGQREPGPCSPPSNDELLARLGVDGLRGRRVGGLSGGQRRRLAVALAFLNAPPVVVLDEATSNLDESHRAETWRIVREYADRGGTVLATSHILADIDTHADNMVALVQGRVVLAGALAGVRARLGGTRVQVRLDAITAELVSTAVNRNRLGIAVLAPPGTYQWHTDQPLALVAELARLAPDASDVVVGPVPLAELLDRLARDSTAPTRTEEATR